MCRLSEAVRHTQGRRPAWAVAQAGAYRLWPAATQPHAARVCRFNNLRWV